MSNGCWIPTDPVVRGLLHWSVSVCHKWDGSNQKYRQTFDSDYDTWHTWHPPVVLGVQMDDPEPVLKGHFNFSSRHFKSVD
eukprot:4356873-Pyramimonas_sp.AAC.1